MARVVLGPILGDIRGTLGNAVYDNYKGVHIIRSKPTVTTNPHSACQQDVRVALAIFVAGWKATSLSQKNLWGQVASGLIKGQESDARMNRGGLISLPRGPFSGYNAFIAFNLNRYTSGYSLLTDILMDAPLGQSLPEPLATFSVTKNSRDLIPAWTYINPGAQDARIVVWIKSIDAGVHPQITYSEARNADGSTTITQVKRTSGTWVSLPNGVYQLQAVIVNKYGLCSQPSSLEFIQLGGADVFTYLADPVAVKTTTGIVATIARTNLSLAAQIPAGAHSAIIRAKMQNTTLAIGGDTLSIYQSSTQTIPAIKIVGPPGPSPYGNYDEGVVPIKSDRSIEYAVSWQAGNTDAIEIILIGYIE